MCGCGDAAKVALSLSVILVLVFFSAVWDPVCAVQARMESFQAAVIESVVLEVIGMMTSRIGSSLWLSTASARTPGPYDLMWDQGRKNSFPDLQGPPP